MAQIVYRTKDGDVLDAICMEFYANDVVPLPIVYNANPGLADIGPVLPAGIDIILPDLPKTAHKIPVVLPWT